MTINETSAELVEVGRRIGHDLYVHGWAELATDWPACVIEGYVAARAQKVSQRQADRFVRKWLQLRLGALARGRRFDEAVTPAALALIDVAECPVLRIPLTHGELKPSDWSIDRINNEGAYALFNLMVMSCAANKAKGSRSFAEVYGLSLGEAEVDGLTPIQWLRMASCMVGPCYVNDSSRIPVVPLLAPIPPCTVAFATQIIQEMLTLQAGRPAGKNTLLKLLSKACRTEGARYRLVLLMDAVHFGLKGLERSWDVWLSARVMKAFVDWYGALSEGEQLAVGAVAQSMSLAGRAAIDVVGPWALASKGYV